VLQRIQPVERLDHGVLDAVDSAEPAVLFAGRVHVLSEILLSGRQIPLGALFGFRSSILLQVPFTINTYYLQRKFKKVAVGLARARRFFLDIDALFATMRRKFLKLELYP
jgi:hypothetical protein